MNKSRIEAFSDGVLAIIITIMVLELKMPHGTDLEAIKPIFPTLGIYILSFVFIGIYWGNHHHLLHTAEKVVGKAPCPVLLRRSNFASPAAQKTDVRTRANVC